MKQLIIGLEARGDGLFVRGRLQEKNSDEEQRKMSKSKNSNKNCNYYKKKGHIKECFKLHNRETKFRNKKGKKSRKSGEAIVVESYQIDGELLVTSDVDSRARENWILDSGCMFHMTPNRDWFSTYELKHKDVVLMGNNASCKVAGIGTIHIRMFDEVVRTLGDVKHVLDLKRNLISLSTLDAKGYKYTGEGGVLKISKGALVVMKGHQKTARLYVLQGATVAGDVAVASCSLSKDDITKLWHMRLRHMNENGMAKLSRGGILDG